MTKTRENYEHLKKEEGDIFIQKGKMYIFLNGQEMILNGKQHIKYKIKKGMKNATTK